MPFELNTQRFVVAAVSLLAVVMVIAPPSWLPAGTALTSAVALVAIALFATGLVAEPIAALVFFLPRCCLRSRRRRLSLPGFRQRHFGSFLVV